MNFTEDYPRFNVLSYLVQVLPETYEDAQLSVDLIFKAFTESGGLFEDPEDLVKVVNTLEEVDFISVNRSMGKIKLSDYIVNNLFI